MPGATTCMRCIYRQIVLSCFQTARSIIKVKPVEIYESEYSTESSTGNDPWKSNGNQFVVGRQNLGVVRTYCCWGGRK